jgi:LysM repeat protein
MRLQALFFVLISFVVTSAARSQSNELLIQGQTGKLYLEHTVVAKETWYSMGRLYNIGPRQIAAFNHLVMARPLVIGATIQIPLTAVNFSQNGVKTAAETLVPLYHIIQEKEWLYRISINHNKVPVPSLEKWNKINKDQAKAGMHLIVGFLKVKTALSALATSTPAPVAAAVVPGGSTAAGNPTTATGGHPSNAALSSMLGDSPVSAVTGGSPSSAPAIHFNGGFFKVDFIETGKSASGTAGIFKSTSGWQDGKYYALMNNVPVGTIVKVSVAGSEKSVYAKVLGQLPDMKESVGLTIRISNAAASELGAGERLNVDLRY